MKEIKIVIIDDSHIIHELLQMVISSYSEIKIIGHAFDGLEGIEVVKNLSPDVVIMDIGMPKLDGLEAIQEIMHEKPTPIIVFSAASKNIVNLGFKAIEFGAVDIIEKPFSNDLMALKKHMEENLIKSIKTFADFKVIRRIKKSETYSRLNEEVKRQKELENKFKESIEIENNKGIIENLLVRSQNFPVIAIAASTGGPQTLKIFLEDITKRKMNAGIVIVQHMAEGFMEGFREWLSLYSSIPVVIADNGGIIKPNIIYIAPGEYHLIFTRDGRFSYLDSPPIQGIRPSADIMLSSIAEVYRERVVAIIMTGMGEDGTKGIYEIKKNGGYIISQDEESSLIFGMPKSAIETGKVDKILNISSMPDFLENFCNERYKTNK